MGTRVLVVGARRTRQGIGEFVARCFHESGAEVRAIVGTTEESVSEARKTLERRYGIECTGYTSLTRALERENPEIVAICSPHGYHREHLEEVARNGLNCLCEKPLWWEQVSGREAETDRLLRLFEERGQYLGLITQWPETLGSYFKLFPRLREEEVKRFDMLLSPSSAGPDMVPDAASHPLSMLQSLLGSGKLASVRARWEDSGLTRLRLDFEYCHSRGRTEVCCRFSRCEEPPRAASYSLNGHEVERVIQLPAYDMFLRDGDRTIQMEDPLGLLVKGFLNKVKKKAPLVRPLLMEGIVSLEILMEAARKAVGTVTGEGTRKGTGEVTEDLGGDTR